MLSATLFSTLTVLIGLASPTVAHAEPGVWDIEDFDSCTEILNDGLNESMQEKLDDTKGCCRHSGGVWNEGQQKCEAPPGEASGAGRIPGDLVPRGDLQVATPTPAQPVVPLQPGLPAAG